MCPGWTFSCSNPVKGLWRTSWWSHLLAMGPLCSVLVCAHVRSCQPAWPSRFVKFAKSLVVKSSVAAHACAGNFDRHTLKREHNPPAQANETATTRPGQANRIVHATCMIL